MASDAPTPEQIAEFIDRIAYWRADTMTAGDVTYHNYPVADAQMMKAARDALGNMALWQQDEPKKAVLEGFVAKLQKKLTESIVDKEAGRVEFKFHGSELIDLRVAAGHLKDYAEIRARDQRETAREAGRSRYQKGKR